jgi:hypothetical protein
MISAFIRYSTKLVVLLGGSDQRFEMDCYLEARYDLPKPHSFQYVACLDL